MYQTGALSTLASAWRLSVELAADLVKIALFDVVILVDDSGSMQFEQNGERIEDLKSCVPFVVGCGAAKGLTGWGVRGVHIDGEVVRGGVWSAEGQWRLQGCARVGAKWRLCS